MANLTAEAERLVEASLATNTWRLYESAIRIFEQFRCQFSLPNVWPAPVDHLVHFIAHLSLTGRSFRTARSYLEALKTWHKLNGLHHFGSHFLVKKTMAGFARQRQNKDIRLPITIDILSLIVRSLPAVCSSTYETSLFAAAYLLSFFGFFRISELIPESAKDTSGRACLRSDVTMAYRNAQLIIHLRSSKTDQSGKGVKVILIAVSDSKLCPVAAMQHYLTIRPRVSNYLFIHFDGRPLTRFQYQALLKKALAFYSPNLNLHLYSAHSFRIGAATTAARNGCSASQICQFGRWKSNCFNTYIRTSHLQ